MTFVPFSISSRALEQIDDFDAAILEVETIPGRHRERVAPSDCAHLAISYADRTPELLAVAHKLTVDAGRGFIVREHALMQSQGNELFRSFAKP